MTESVRQTKRLVAAILTIAPGRALLALLLALALGLAEGVGLLALVPLLQLVGLEAGGSLGPIMAGFSDAFDVIGLTPTLPLVLTLYVVIVLIQALLQRAQSAAQASMREEITHGLRSRLYRAIQGTSWVYFSKTRGSVFAELLTHVVDRVATAVDYLLDLFVILVIGGVYIALALRVSQTMSLLVLGAGVVLGLTVRTRLTMSRRAGERYGHAITELHNAAADHLNSVKLAKSYNAVERHAAQFEELSRELGDASRQASVAWMSTRLWGTVGSASVLAGIVYAARDVMQMPPAALFLLIFLFARLVPRVTALYEKAQVLAGELPALEAVLDAEGHCLEAAEPLPVAQQELPFNACIDLRGVTFRYQPDEVASPALQQVDITIPVRRTTAIVGPSGAGKSTVADVLMGLVTPQSGRVSVDGVPLSADRLADWRERIGYVSQDTFLFHDTIRNNLLWARPDAGEPELWVALSRAAADDFVRRCPLGLDTTIGDRGITLSGGERQRLSLARALLRQPKLLILDEATSALDSENERRIQAAIEYLHEQITIVVITHRLSTIRHADMIYMMENGQVAEWGTWTTLYQANKRFRAFCEAQHIDPTVRFEKWNGTEGEAEAAG